MSAHFRNRFPILEKKTYLASHSLGAVPRATEASLLRYYDDWATQGIQAWHGPWWDILSEFGDTVGEVLGAPKGTIVPMENVTRGFAAVCSALPWSGSKRNKVVMTSLEFLTSYPFFQGLADSTGARIHIVESKDGITVPIEELLAAIDEETLLVATSHVYFRSGAVQDLQKVAAKCASAGAYSLGDGYQSGGIVPIDLVKSGLDFFVGGSHKWFCGGPGAGYLYVKQDRIQKLEPRFSGWFGIKDAFAYEPSTRFQPAEGIFRFLAGTPAIPGLYAAIEGVRTVRELGMEKIRATSLQLTSQIMANADEREITVRTPRKDAERSGMVCLDFPEAEAATKALIARDVIVDYRPNCGLRLSPHFYNNSNDIEQFFRTLDQIRDVR